LVKKKSNNECRMCVDYIDINKHHPKDPLGIPRIDQVMDFSQLGASYSNSFIATQATITSPSWKKTISRPLSSLRMHIQPCLSGQRTQVLHISAPSTSVSRISYTTMLMCTWMMLLSRPETMTTSSLTSKRLQQLVAILVEA
jgi:hypothetical protein